MEVKLQQLRDTAKWPKYASEGAAGADFCACLEQDTLRLAPLQRALVPTGFAMQLPGADYVGLLYARSGLASRLGLALSNGVGVIDSDYRGEICVALTNFSNEVVEIKNGERIAQLLVMPVIQANFVPCEALEETQRSAGGFGSTGRV